MPSRLQNAGGVAESGESLRFRALDEIRFWVEPRGREIGGGEIQIEEIVDRVDDNDAVVVDRNAGDADVVD